MRFRLFVFFAFLFLFASNANSQYSYGTTGLLNMPTADMQKDKTVLIGGSFLEKHNSTGRWFYNTWNYYANITIFPWLEVSYNMILHKALKNDPALKDYWVPRTYGKFVNQDRQFSVRLRLWKEGWGKEWTPQIVIGSDDISSHSWGNTSRRFNVEDFKANGFNNRYYFAITKHIIFENAVMIGVHLSYLYNVRSDYPLNAPAWGTNIKFNFPLKGKEENVWPRLINGLNLMAEFYPANNEGVHYVLESGGDVPSRGMHVGIWDVNLGGCYSLMGDKINLYGELYGCRFFSGGIQLKLHLK